MDQTFEAITAAKSKNFCADSDYQTGNAYCDIITRMSSVADAMTVATYTREFVHLTRRRREMRKKHD